jgi:peptide/nickel transport system permease protein
VTRFIATRFLGSAFTLFLSSILVFSLVRLVPGDAISSILSDETYTPKQADALRELYGLGGPIYEQYFNWVSALLHGNLGFSLIARVPVSELVAANLPRTLYLMGGGVVAGLLIAIPAGIIGAAFRGRGPDTFVKSGTALMLAVPQFFGALLLIILFVGKLDWLPPPGYVRLSDSVSGSIKSMILPWLTIGLAMSALVARVLRSRLLDVLGEDYIRTARARGFSEKRVMFRHALRNASIPTLTVIALDIGYLLGGAIVVEKVFAIPGIGLLIVDGISGRDYPVVQSVVLLFAAAFIVVNFLTDLSYGILDPRVRAGRR